jgi:DNA invertase Pin-like site-specific DNA recombinase
MFHARKHEHGPTRRSCGWAGRREIDLVAAWSVDRLGRSLFDLLGFLGELHAKAIDLYLHQQGLDTSTPAGRAMFEMLGVFAEFERAMIRERVKAAMIRAKESGTRSGRAIGRPIVDPAKAVLARQLLAAGESGQRTAQLSGLSRRTVRRLAISAVPAAE